ncbi:MAG: YraN family protein [Humidesulfovibrio sp.]|uniref:YraN family protein n=1 Tax=Humidesulfovibrio sp. TaxID=2910988 RepID=UPI0027F4F09E|nr:YraN family protein [Humidesulfovibrio sp.]MDQ7836136.1 YraN family protein [Humidesulfovibrio sp.]
MPAGHLDLGRRGEDAAERLLAGKGLRILERNLRLGRLELDLVCEEGDTLVFVEVKTRAEGSLATPAEGLTSQKRSRLLRAAQAYLTRHDLWHRPCRLDLVAVLFRAGSLHHIEHTPDAFSADAPGSWQPW